MQGKVNENKDLLPHRFSNFYKNSKILLNDEVYKKCLNDLLDNIDKERLEKLIEVLQEHLDNKLNDQKEDLDEKLKGLKELLFPKPEYKKVKTFCCDSKKSKSFNFGTSNKNVGTGCKNSYDGQCSPLEYKFRCFDANIGKGFNREVIDEENNDEKCKYVAGILGKTASSVGNAAKGTAYGTYAAVTQAPRVALGFLQGGKKRKSNRRKTSKKVQTYKNKKN